MFLKDKKQKLLEVFEHIAMLKIAQHFLYPVPLEIYPNYLLKVACPMDVSTIIARIKNNYYRSEQVPQKQY